MGWFYEVNIANQDIDDNDKCMVEGLAIVQGKNSSTDEYVEYYMDRGKPYRYDSVDDLMPDTEGSPEDVRLMGDYEDSSGKTIYVTYTPVFRDGRWWVKEVKEGE